MTTTLILGGTRSGKSRYAESLLIEEPEVTYVATGPVPDDDDTDWRSRVQEHQRRRPESWHTVEAADVTRAILAARSSVLVDCLGNWVTRIIDDADAWEDRDKALELVHEHTAELLALWAGAPYDIVAVSNEVGMAVVPATASGRLFQEALGRMNASLGAAADHVRLVVAGRVLDLDQAPLVPWSVA